MGEEVIDVGLTSDTDRKSHVNVLIDSLWGGGRRSEVELWELWHFSCPLPSASVLSARRMALSLSAEGTSTANSPPTPPTTLIHSTRTRLSSVESTDGGQQQQTLTTDRNKQTNTQTNKHTHNTTAPAHKHTNKR